MADDQDKSQKTEEATEQKLKDARKKGDVAKSTEIPSWLLLAVSALILAAFSGPLATYMKGWLQSFFITANRGGINGPDLGSMSIDISRHVALGLGLVLALLMVAAFAGHVVQHGLLWAPDKVTPKFSKLSPIEGFKRVFGPQALANFLKGLAKMSLVGLAAIAVMWPRRTMLASLPYVDLGSLMPVVRDSAMVLMLAALSVFALVAAADYAYQRQSFLKRMRMSRKDIKDELKNTEGDPQVRARLAQVRKERSRQRMMQAVPKASVVIANPTHFAVALYYEQGETPAPVCVAKGVDDLALRIRALAEESGVPVVENPPLARALFATTEIEKEIPADHFKAVAKIIGYVLSLAERRRK